MKIKRFSNVVFDKKTRFLAVGFLNTLVGLGTYPVLYMALTPLGYGYLVVLVITQFICTTFSFLTNKHFVFNTHGNYFFEYLRFLSFHIGHVALNFVCLPILVEMVGLSPIVAQLFFAVVVIVTSYFWHDKITFKN